MGLPPGPAVPHQGQLAIDILADACADGLAFDFICGDEVYGSCTELRGVPGRARPVLRAAGCVVLHPHAGRADEGDLRAGGEAAADRDQRRWEVRSAGRAPRASRWYAWAWIATAPPRGTRLLVRRHLETGELAYHYCFVPMASRAAKTRLITRSRAALASGRGIRVRQGLLRPGPVPGTALHRDPPPHRAGHGRPGHLRRHRRPAERPAPAPRPRHPSRPDQPPPADPGMIPLTVAEVKRLLAAALPRRHPPGHAAHWLRMASPPPGTITMVPPTRPPRTATMPWSASNWGGSGTGAVSADCGPVSSPRPSNRACGSPAHGLPTFFTVGVRLVRASPGRAWAG